MRSLKFKVASSKFFLALMIVVMTNLLMWVPMIVNIMAGMSLVLMTGSEYVSLMLGIYGLYCGLNVAQKHVIGKFGASDPDLDDMPHPKKSESTEYEGTFTK
jgi:hypothetical protein